MSDLRWIAKPKLNEVQRGAAKLVSLAQSDTGEIRNYQKLKGGSAPLRFGMKTKWNPHWKASKKPSKQRKYRWNAPLHIVHELMSAHMSKELRQKYGRRSMAIRKGDKVKVMRGQFGGTIGEIDEVDLVHSKAYVKGAEFKGKAGTAPRRYPLNASKLMLISLNTDDKLRVKKLGSKGLETAKGAMKR